MPLPNLLDQGLNIMLLGMGTVFVFLTLLVATTLLMSLVVNKYFKTEHSKGTTSSQLSTTQADDRVKQETVLAVITATIHRVRSDHK